MRARTQVCLFGAAYVLCDLARWVTVGDPGTATAHARSLLSVEQGLGLAVERSVQHALSGGAVMWLLSNVYLAAQLAVLPGSLLWLWRRDKTIYRRLRDTILATWLLAVPIYAAFPVAPPRLAGVGMVDTITAQTGVALDSSLTTSFYNELAAVPSLHVGFAVAIGIALAAALRQPLLRFVALLWGPAIALAVVATGNHFVFDIAAGVVAAGAGYVVGAAVARTLRLRSTRPATPLRSQLAGA